MADATTTPLNGGNVTLTPEPDAPVFRGPDIRTVAIVFLILAWITVSLRCYVRIFMTKLFRVDDWLALATLV
jgi:hypothetical protein